jgi:hypothetical protein
MKKSHVIAGIVVLGAALSLVVYINMKSPSKSGNAQQIADGDEPAGDVPTRSSGSYGFFGNQAGTDSDVAANGSADPKTVKLETFVANARIAEEFKFLDEQMELQFERLKNSAGPEELATFEELRNQLKGEDLLAKYKEVLREKFTEAQLDSLNEIYKDPEFVRYKEADANNRTEQGQKEMADFIKNNKRESIPAERYAAADELVTASGAPEQMMKMLDGVGGLFSGGAGKNDQDSKVYKEMLMKSITESLVMTHLKNYDGQPVESIRNMKKTVANPILQEAEALKIGFITQELVTVVEPKIQEAMKK